MSTVTLARGFASTGCASCQQMNKPKRKKPEPRFRVGELVNLPVRIVKVDLRYRSERYMVQAHVSEWILEDMVEANELRSLPKQRRG